ncbi:MAG: AAA family ATPase [Salinivirgaceae bacterium]|nr:AAA family ATPase [Salinivirgaceae bacterium]
MEIGDIVVSCFSEKETDAIGIITGDYEYIEEWANDYPRCRKVRWIWKGTPNDIIGLNNNKKLTLSTIYKLDIDPITIKDYINKISGYSDSKKEERKFVFIIDEINRGEINKIFGELFFSIDPGYRGEKGRVQTQYQNMVEDGDAFKKGFFVPENVYIIGTMNDIDRSVESMDFAFRRRFAFKEVTAKETQTMLDSDDAWKDETGVSQKPENNVIDEIKARMNSLNAAIEEIEGLSSAYHIGASYFLKLANYKGKNDSYNYDELWIYHLEGLLREYLRGMPNAEDNIIKLHNAYNKGNSDNKSVDVTENESTANSGQSGE